MSVKKRKASKGFTDDERSAMKRGVTVTSMFFVTAR